MVRCLSKMMQKPVLGYYSGRRLGSVCGFSLHPETHRLLSVAVRRHKWSAAKEYWMRDISKDSTRLSLLSYAEEGERRDKKDEDIYICFPLCIGRSVRTHAKTQGQIADIWVNWPGGTVAWYEVSKGYLDDMRRGRAYARGYWVKTNQQNWIFQCIQEV
jgi:uncharacterized protein YrrD